MLKKKIKKAATALCVCALTVGAMTLLSHAAYTDTHGHWAENAINKWSEQYGILTGYEDGSFQPDKGVTRAELAMILDRVLNFKYLPKKGFNDVKGDEWFADAVLNLKAAGVLSADKNGDLAPNQIVTREEAARVFSLAFDILRSYDDVPYLDKAEIDEKELGYVSGMTKSGYMQGDGANFSPKVSLTRAAVVTMIDNIVSYVITDKSELAGVYEGSVVIANPKGIVIRNCDIQGDLYISESMPEGSVSVENTHILGGIVDHRDTVEEMKLGQGVKVSLQGRDYIRYDFYGFEKIETLEKNLLDPKKFTYDGDFPLYNGKRLVRGVDVSAWQEKIDWKQVAKFGIDFAMIRAGYRGYSAGALVKDAYFDANIKGAINNGLDVGVYFFSQALTPEEAREEAEYVLELVKGYELSYPIVYDWEFVTDSSARTKDATGEQITACALAFCEVIYEAGYTPMVYTNMNMGYVYLDLEELYKYPVWLAEYREYPKFYYHFDMWQLTSSGRVPGIEGNVDLNLAFTDIPAIKVTDEGVERESLLK